MRRSCVISSSPFGVSRIFMTPANRGSRMMRRNGSAPSEPSRDQLVTVAARVERRLRVVEVEQALAAPGRLCPPTAARRPRSRAAGRSRPNRGDRCRRRRRPGRAPSADRLAQARPAPRRCCRAQCRFPRSSRAARRPARTPPRGSGCMDSAFRAHAGVAIVDEIAGMRHDRTGMPSARAPLELGAERRLGALAQRPIRRREVD